MAKICGVIAYAELKETSPGVWEEVITDENKRTYYGDLKRNSSRLQSTSQLNDDITISNEFSIIADPYAYQNFHMMRYVEFMGAKWKISSVDVQYPRLNLSVGGVWNGA